MAERTDWKAKYLDEAARSAKLEADLTFALENATSLGKENDELRGEIERLNKQIGRAKLEGIAGLTSFLLESE